MPNQLFYAVSTDLENWCKHQPLARNVTVNENGNPRRAIDAAVALVDGKYYLVWKAEQISHAGRGDNKLALARSQDLMTWEVP